MKKCVMCKVEKSLERFHKNKISPDGYTNICKECRVSYHAGWYLKNKNKVDGYNKKHKEEIQKYIRDFLKNCFCVDCGETDPIVLEFDHVRGEKRFSIAEAPHRKVSIKTLKLEIEKCEIRCANCHRRKTYKQFGYLTPSKL